MSPAVRSAMSTITKLRRTKSRLSGGGYTREGQTSVLSARKGERRLRNLGGVLSSPAHEPHGSVVNALSFETGVQEEDSLELQPVNLNLPTIEESARPGFDESLSQSGGGDSVSGERRDDDEDEADVALSVASESTCVSELVGSSWDVLKWQRRMAKVLPDIIAAFQTAARLQLHSCNLQQDNGDGDSNAAAIGNGTSISTQDNTEAVDGGAGRQPEVDIVVTTRVSPPQSRAFSPASALFAELVEADQARLALQRQVRSQQATMAQLVTYNAELKRDLRLLCARLEVLNVVAGGVDHSVGNKENNKTDANVMINKKETHGGGGRRRGSDKNSVVQSKDVLWEDLSGSCVGREAQGGGKEGGLPPADLLQMHATYMAQIGKTTRACLGLLEMHGLAPPKNTPRSLRTLN
jgi:hypothetical protein